MSVKVVKDLVGSVLKSIVEMESRQVLVGIPADAKVREHGDPITNAQLGYLHEFGSPAQNIPARPFLNPGVTAATDRCAEVLKKAASERLSRHGALEDGLNKAGLIAQASVKMTLKRGEGFIPLAPATLAARKRKGFMGESPLLRTGQLMNSVTYVIRDA